MSDIDILISVHKQYVTQMLSGMKTVELRRRAVPLTPGSRVWIYTKAPTAAVEALGVVSSVLLASPNTIWKTYQAVTGISHIEFENYFKGSQIGCAIVFEKVLRLKNAVPLRDLRNKIENFHPPQFFKRLPRGSKELLAIVETQCTGVVRADRTTAHLASTPSKRGAPSSRFSFAR